MISIKRIVFFCCCFFSFVLNAQDLIKSEKIYVHTDREVYIEGDTLWAKAYVLDTETHHLSDSSKVLYVLLIDSLGQKIHENKIEINEGNADFYFVLPKNSCYLVAYTKVMLNYETDYFFRKQINILPNLTKSKPCTGLAVQFFPEGGNLVEGLMSRIVFKATDKCGKGKDIKGIITTNYGDIVTDISSVYLGIGSFNFRPEKGLKYIVIVNNEKFDLPEIIEKGTTLKIQKDKTKGGILIEIKSNLDYSQDVTLRAHQNGNIIFVKKIKNFYNRHLLFLRNEFLKNDGLIYFTLFDQLEKPICERLYFVKNGSNSIPITLNSNISKKNDFKTIELDFELITTNSPLNMSVSVLDASIDGNYNYANIYTYVLLNSNLKGNIEEPNSYFEKDTPEFFLDNLILAHGWRKFVSKPKNYEVEKSLSIVGQALRNGKPIKNETIILSIWDLNGLKINVVSTDISGKFKLSGNWKEKLTIIGNDKRHREIELLLTSSFVPKLDPSLLTNLSAKNNDVVFDYNLLLKKIRAEKSVILNELTVKGTKFDPLIDDSRRLLYNGVPDISLKITKEISSGAIDVAQMLEGRFPGIPPGLLSLGALNDVPKANSGISGLSGNNGPPSAGSSNASSSSNATPIDQNRMSYGVLILLDGVIVPPSQIKMIPPSIVDRVDLLRDITKTSMFGFNAADGKVLNILTKKGLASINGLDDNTQYHETGFTTEREFYSTMYESKEIDSQRPTLYWNPNLQTNDKGKVHISIPNISIDKKVKICVNGTDGKGNFIIFSEIIE